jgi:hypothetical protein
MICLGGMGLMLFAGAPPGLAQTTSSSNTATAPADSAEQQVDAVIAGYQQAIEDFSHAYQSAKTDQERQKLFDTKYPTESKYFPKLMAIARAHPKTEAASKALQWVIEQSGRSAPTKTSADAFALITRDFAADPKIVEMVRGLGWTMDPAAEPLFRAVIHSNPDPAAKGAATFALARFLKNNSELVRTIKSSPASATQMAQSFGQSNVDALRKHDPDAMMKEAVVLFEQVKKQYPDVPGGFNGTLGKSADAELFELQHLAIDQTAPEITGADVDGKPMKLSDFRGKVVMLDFWGDW